MLNEEYFTNKEETYDIFKNEDLKKSEQLQNKITTEINELLKSNSIDGAILAQSYIDDDDIKKLAKTNNLSEGKVNLINKIIASGIQKHNGVVFSFDELSKLSINELKNISNEQLNKLLEGVI